MKYSLYTAELKRLLYQLRTVQSSNINFNSSISNTITLKSCLLTIRQTKALSNRSVWLSPVPHRALSSILTFPHHITQRTSSLCSFFRPSYAPCTHLPFIPYICQRRASVSDSMTDNKYSCDYARLGTSSCKKCKQKLEKGGLRLAKVYESRKLI